MRKQKVWACAHSLHYSERERERKREREGGRERKREGERDKEREREGGRERVKEGENSSLTRNKLFNCPELLFLFLKGMTGTLAPFSYLVYNIQSSTL
jgi:hypothetical protein